MSWKCQSTHPFFRPFFRPFVTALFALALCGCANNSLLENNVEALTSSTDAEQALPDYVRNMPKSKTGNMPEYTVFGKRYRVLDTAANFTQQGTASWYGKKFHGRKTSSGEVYDMNALTAAHKNLPLPTYARVTNLENNRSVIVKINDRGPFVGNRVIDLSLAAAMELNMAAQGTANVLVEALSTHLIAENDYEKNDKSDDPAVGQVFGQVEADNTLLKPEVPEVPEVVEPTLAAIPLQDQTAVVEQFESEIEPIVEGEQSLIAELDSDTESDKVDDSNDGYVELIAKADDPLSGVPDVEVPVEVNETSDAAQPLQKSSPELSENSYFIQLGAFGHAPNAEALVVDVIEKTGLKAFVETDTQQGLYRVKMGPFEKGIKLETTVNELANVGIDSYTKLAYER